jgi:hypothetical protein
LLCAIDTLFELKDVPIRDLKTRWCLHVEVLLEVSIEVGSLDIHLVEFKVMFGSEGENCLEG